MTEKPRRRWFRFSLRTLLVAMTVLCCWLAWESSVVRSRRAELNQLRANGAFEVTTADQWAERMPPGYTGRPPANVSLVRRWLGDQAIQEIGYYSHYLPASKEELARLSRVFPEATMQERQIPLEPCHPGCFPRGTLVETPRGPRRIETVQAGDRLIALLPGGELTTARVQSVFVTENRLWRIATEDGVLLTTETQPLCLAADRFRAAGELEPGDEILRCASSSIHSTTVLSVSRTERIEQVFNVVLGDSEAFVAGGFLARSKPPAVALDK